MKIKNLEIKNNNPLYMAPMAGITDKTFREIVKEMGADITCTEMVSAKALSYNNKNTYELLKISKTEGPVAVQIFGSEPDIMAQEAAKLEETFDIIDINMGCPVNKVVSNGEGSALLANPKLASEIVKKVSDSVKIPVTVKMRIGIDKNNINAVSFAKMLEESGAAAITVHGRTRTQLYSGRADYDLIREVKESVSIPVFGNGDVFSVSDAMRMREETGVDGIAIARGAEGNPWLFREVRAALDGKEIPKRPDIFEIKNMALRHMDGLIEDKGEYTGIREMRKHLAYYSAGLEGSAAFRGKINYASTSEEMKNMIETFFSKK